MRAEEEGAEKHYLKQKWRQNPPVRSILLPPPPPPFFPSPTGAGESPAGFLQHAAPGTGRPRHKLASALSLPKEINKTSRTETATTLPLGGQPPKSSPKVTRRGTLAPQRPSQSWEPGVGWGSPALLEESTKGNGGEAQVSPHVLTWAEGARSFRPHHSGRGSRSCSSSAETRKRNGGERLRSLGTSL